jgi:hypothetical protein
MDVRMHLNAVCTISLSVALGDSSHLRVNCTAAFFVVTSMSMYDASRTTPPCASRTWKM